MITGGDGRPRALGSDSASSVEALVKKRSPEIRKQPPGAVPTDRSAREVSVPPSLMVGH